MRTKMPTEKSAMRLVWPQVRALLVLCLLLTACKDQGEEFIAGPRPGKDPTTYEYRGYTSGGTLGVSGSMTIAGSDSNGIVGTWVLEGVGSVDRLGPQIGAGILEGTLTDSRITIDLNPGWRDNNVILHGSIQNDRISGTWLWVTFAGPTSTGSFEAVRKK